MEKTFCPLRLVLWWLALCLSASTKLASGQTTSVHQITGISANSQTAAMLALAGSPPAPLQKYYDLFPLEVSADLIAWNPLATVVRTNVTNEVAFLDAASPNVPARFYRTPTNQFSTPFFSPTGPHRVGTLSRMLTDATRTNRFKVRTNSSFMVTFWYPAQARAGATPAAYMDRPLAERRAYWGTTYTNRVPAFVQFAAADAPVASAPERFPVIIYSHGLGDMEGRGVRTENTERIQELASHGYIVVAMDHTDTYATVFPPDRLVMGGNAGSFDFLNDRLKDVKFLLDYVAQLNMDDPKFSGRFDLDRLGIMGWSFGGGTAAEACRLEDRLKVAVLLDGYLQSAPILLRVGLAKPFLSMNSGALISDNTTLFNKSPKDAYLLSIQGASHEAFTDNSWIVNPVASSRRRAQAMNACLVSFFNKHLMGVDDQLLENPGATYPDVISFRKK